MAALENDRPPLACVHAVGVLKNITHHIIARVVFIATCRPHPSPSRPDVSPLGLHGFHLYPSLSPSPSRQRGSGKMRNDRAAPRFEGPV